jgi:hypothetical protein
MKLANSQWRSIWSPTAYLRSLEDCRENRRTVSSRAARKGGVFHARYSAGVKRLWPIFFTALTFGLAGLPVAVITSAPFLDARGASCGWFIALLFATLCCASIWPAVCFLRWLDRHWAIAKQRVAGPALTG